MFDWDETFELDLVGNRQLDLLVYSWDPQHRHKLCYKGSVHLATLLKESPLHQLALKVEPRGTLYLRLRYTDAHQTFKRRGLPVISLATRVAPLFGVDLDTVVNIIDRSWIFMALQYNNYYISLFICIDARFRCTFLLQVSRESKTGGVPGGVSTALAMSGTQNVPIIVWRCVEEVERRGLDIIGNSLFGEHQFLYRFEIDWQYSFNRMFPRLQAYTDCAVLQPKKGYCERHSSVTQGLLIFHQTMFPTSML